MTGTAVTAFHSRLPMPTSMDDMDARKWRVLCETIFPSAKTPEAVVMALDYCRARGLDVFKRPVHIVPMWNSALRREVETVWPGINEIQTTAARTKQWAGMDEPKWGSDATRTFQGRRRSQGNWEAAEATVTFPEWCAVTVYRMIDGQRCAFTEPVYWLEAYSRSGGANSELPTDMWVKRPRGQLHKVAKAAALRAAFPEEASDYSAEEMEGKEIEAGGVVIDHEPTRPNGHAKPSAPALTAPPVKPPHDPATGEILPPHAIPAAGGDDFNPVLWGGQFIAAIKTALNHRDIDEWMQQNGGVLDDIRDNFPRAWRSIETALAGQRAKLGPEEPDLLGPNETESVLAAK